jgi:hypothetical protein
MLPHRKIMLVLCIVLVGGSLSVTAGYAIHQRSDGYRLDVERRLSEFFELPCDIGRIRGHTFSSRLFGDVAVWLPGRRDRVFSCAKAIWSELVRDGREVNELTLANGQLTLGSDRWAQTDYRQVLKSSLGHDFEDLRLSSVMMQDFEIAFARAGFALRCREASGEIDMSNPRSGVARLHAYELNGQPIVEGVRIVARFLPKNGLEVSDLLLVVPRVPLGAVGLGSVVGGDLSQGAFEGSIQYLAKAGSPEFLLRGNLEDARLEELTRRLPVGPLSGRVSVDVQQARFAEGMLTQVRGRGAISDLGLSFLSSVLGGGPVSGSASIHLDSVDIAEDHVHRLQFTGQAQDVSLEQVLRPIGRGSATGRLAIRVNSVDIVDDAIKSADVEIRALPPTGEAGTIDRELLLGLAEEALDIKWPPALPERILPAKVEYAEFGMRLLVRDNRLRILGTHGSNGKKILTIRVFGQPFGVIEEQTGSIDLAPMWADFKSTLSDYGRGRMEQWLKRRGSETPR